MLTLAGVRVSRCGFTRRSGAEAVTWLVSEARKKGEEGQSHSSCIFCTWLPSDQLSTYKMKLFVKAFCFLKVVSWVARDDRASGSPCCGTCFPSWDPNTLVVLKEEFFDPGHSFAMKQLCPCLSSQKNFPDVKRQAFPGKKYLFIWALLAHLLHPPPSYTQCGQIFHFLKSFKK